LIKKRTVTGFALTLAVLVAPVTYGAEDHIDYRNGIRHVLLISIDGMHALDYENCVNGGYCPNLADLGKHGVNYTRTSTSRPSDSFPGLMALVTGGTPRSVGAFYDLSYDRVLAPPTRTTGNGLAGGQCIENVPNGTTAEFEEGVEFDQSKVNGGGPYDLTDNGIKSIDPTRLPRDPFNHCLPVYPWQFIRTNSIYGVIHAAGGYTAWSDKHAVYAAVSGHGDNADNVDDYYSPEVNSVVIALPGVKTATGQSCDPIRDKTQLGDWTMSFLNIQCNDALKVNAVLNQIDGMTHDGLHKAPVATLFGMNFQAVSVGQKLIEGGVKGGYTDAAGTPTGPMLDEIKFVDASIGQMVSELKTGGLLESTLIIVTAKHGQSPVDTHRFVEPATSPADLVAAYLPFSESPLNPNGIGPTQDDISLLWLKNSSDTSTAVGILEANATIAAIGQIFYGPSLETMYNVGDSRTPDIIVQPNVGVIYTHSTKKQAEHGGFANDDTNVMMLVSKPDFAPRTVTSFVETTQVAPTILQGLGLDPGSLDAVQQEGTPVLPGLNFK
jgi:Type I phosphodiesterase / nucleotide pyrophosphatase